MKDLYIECNCYTDEHTLRFSMDPEDGHMYLHVFLENDVFLKRLWKGIRYILGYKSKFGQFTEVILAEPGKLQEMRNFLTKGLNIMSNKELQIMMKHAEKKPYVHVEKKKKWMDRWSQKVNDFFWWIHFKVENVKDFFSIT